MSKIDPDYAATIISIVPFAIAEEKPGIYPGYFVIPASTREAPEVLNVGESIYHVEVDEGRSIVVKCSPHEIARSIVEDYVTSNLAYSENDNAAPGIFWKPGFYTKIEVIAKFSKEIKDIKERQWKWFIKLVRMADDDWEKTRQHKSISDMQRFACKALGQDRPWIIQPTEAMLMSSNQIIKCPSCMSVLQIGVVVCANCRCIIDMDKYKKLNFVEVK